MLLTLLRGGGCGRRRRHELARCRTALPFDVVLHREEGDQRDDGGSARQHVAEPFETISGWHGKVTPLSCCCTNVGGVAQVPSLRSHTFGEHVRGSHHGKYPQHDNR